MGMVVPETPPPAIPLPQLLSSHPHRGQWDQNPLGVDLNPNYPTPVIWGLQEQPVGWGREKPCTCSQRGFSSSLPGEKGEGAVTVVALSPWGARKGGDPKGEWG